MGLIIRLIELLIIVIPIAGAAFAGYRAVQRRRPQVAEQPTDRPVTEPQPTGSAATWKAIQRTVVEHDRTDTRWLEYELDPITLLEYPLMTDLTEAVTERFHRAKWRADLLRPQAAESLLDDRDSAAEYRQAVEEYVSAFNVAEAEARRRRDAGYSDAEKQRLHRARSLLRVASDDAATNQEREQAYRQARKELDGLVELPERTRAQIERGIAGELGA
ncbi:hypothetical protein BVC93_13625 [Mycobacterium sp. MS1601]|uniref:hypothetical protein n=1 Tax=Mycobacterium sp. MS1601 TaxID=1936029 RepID=UPI0009798588|nr:hypothetical protein [Mycobacterium sp. MS1601]AQA03283.1 hypothetical protein BVC93_13625 [Mycobacterium sp. MS1601]